MVSKNFESQIRSLVQWIYCQYGEDECSYVVKQIDSLCKSSQMGQIVKVMKNELKQVKERFVEYYKEAEQIERREGQEIRKRIKQNSELV